MGADAGKSASGSAEGQPAKGNSDAMAADVKAKLAELDKLPAPTPAAQDKKGLAKLEQRIVGKKGG